MKKHVILLFLLLVGMYSCKVSYQFNGSNIDYNLTKTMHIADFQNQALTQYPPLIQTFNNRLKDVYTRNTKLQFINNNADLELDGEIIKFETSPLAVREDGLAGQIRLTMDVRIRFRNNKNPSEDKEQTFSAYRDFSSSQSISDVQDALGSELTEDIVDQIFNATMANW